MILSQRQILDVRQSSRDPEVQYQVILWPDGSLTCNCPACQYGNGCWVYHKIRANLEYQELLKRKVEISEIQLIPMKRQVEEAWELHFQQKYGRKW